MFQPSPRINVSVIRHRKRLPPPPPIVRLGSDEPGCRDTCQDNFRQYLLNTTLHGLKYVGDNTLTFIERIFFGFMFFVVFFLSAYFISNVWNKYLEKPMIISLSSMSTDIRNLPFPAVTICNNNQAVKSVVRKMANDSEDYSMIQSLCTHAVDENVRNSEDGKWAAFQKLLVEVSQGCNELLITCIYGGFEFNCTDIFVTVLTDEGLCCTFNGVNRKFIAKAQYNNTQEFNISAFLDATANDWTPEKGFASEELRLNRSGYPRPVVGTGTNLGLTVVLDGGIDEYYCSSTSSYGFKILLHSPNESPPMISHFGTSVSNGYESRVVITPTISEATDPIRKLPVKVRNCLFEDENYLTFYRIYSRGNCNMECNAKIYLNYCGCILYFQPRFKDDITICGRKDEACVDEVTRQIQMQKNSSFVCDCLPGCFEIKYDAEISMAPLLTQTPLLATKGLQGPNVSITHIYYKNMYYRSEKKEELIGFTEFLSNTGGLLGLFMGFSVFSIIEVFYFLTLRPYSNYMKVSRNRRLAFERMFKKFKRLRSRRTVSALMAHHVERMEVHENNIVYPYVG